MFYFLKITIMPVLLLFWSEPTLLRSELISNYKTSLNFKMKNGLRHLAVVEGGFII